MNPPPPQIMGMGIRKQEKIKKMGWDDLFFFRDYFDARTQKITKLSKYSQVTPHLKACDENFQKINILKPKTVCIN